MKKILVPTDFSPQATAALNFAVQIARKQNAEVLLYHVIESYLTTVHYMSGLVETSQSAEETAFMLALGLQAKQKLANIAADEKYADVTITCYIQEGNFYKNIAEKIADKDVDLIVMGSHGTNATQEYAGSNADKVVRFAHCPVVTIKAEMNLEDIKHVVFATSLEEENNKVVAYLADFVAVVGAKLHILRVNHPGHVMPQREVHTKGKVMADRNYLKDYEINTYADKTIEDGILHFAEDNHIEMIMLGTHSRSGISRILHRGGSVAEGLVTHSNMLVWTCSLTK